MGESLRANVSLISPLSVHPSRLRAPKTSLTGGARPPAPPSGLLEALDAHRRGPRAAASADSISGARARDAGGNFFGRLSARMI